MLLRVDRVVVLQKEVAEQERLREERRRTKRLLKAEKARIEAQGAAAGGVFGPRYYIGYSAYGTVVPRKRGLWGGGVFFSAFVSGFVVLFCGDSLYLMYMVIGKIG